MLSFATAERLAAAALREGMRRRTSYIRPQIAIGKAWGALSLGVSSRAVAGIADRVPAFFQALTVAAQGRMFPAPGGVLLRGENGEIIGAVGVSGDSSDVDEAVGIAAAHEAGLGTEPPRSAA
jgi:uncharacterized protein GlcG (DUF336 family)